MSERFLLTPDNKINTPEEYFKIFKPSSDNDAVLTNSRLAVANEFNSMFGTNKKPSDMNLWKAVAHWCIELGMSNEEAMELDRQLWYERQDVLFNSQPMPGAKEFTLWFAQRGIDLPIISSRPSSYKEITIEWFKLWMPWVKEEQIIIQPNNEMEGDIFKVWMIKLLGIGIHFEDNVSHAHTILNYSDSKVVLLSNNSTLDYYSPEKLVRFKGENGDFPDMYGVNRFFFESG